MWFDVIEHPKSSPSMKKVKRVHRRHLHRHLPNGVSPLIYQWIDYGYKPIELSITLGDFYVEIKTAPGA